MYKPPGGLYLEGRFNGGFFSLPVRGAYIWRGLFSEFYGIRIPCSGFTRFVRFVTVNKNVPDSGIRSPLHGAMITGRSPSPGASIQTRQLSQGMKAGLQLAGPYVVQINRNRAKTQINYKAYDIEG